jgi:hypothetical protein
MNHEINGAALGESRLMKMFMRPLVWGPHVVGGAEPRAERL